jgi:tetratricopeptide (TPR) repeat protein
MIPTNLRQLFGLGALLIGAIVADAQIGGGLNETVNSNMGGVHFITGTVFGPTGKPVNVRMRLKLVSMTRGEVIATTDDAGRFVFSRVSAGTYSIVIDREEGFEAVDQIVDVDTARTPQTYSVSIRLSERRGSSAKPAVLKANGATVPRRAVELYKDSLKLSAAKDHEGAIGLLKKAIQEYPEYQDALNEIGVQYMLVNDLKKAEEELTKVLGINPNAYAPLVNGAIAMFRQKKFFEAENLLLRAIKAKPDAALPYYYLGRCLTAVSRYDESESALRTAIKIGRDEMKEAHRMLADLFLKKGDYGQAVSELKLYLKVVPDAPDAVRLGEIIQQLSGGSLQGPE